MSQAGGSRRPSSVSAAAAGAAAPPPAGAPAPQGGDAAPAAGSEAPDGLLWLQDAEKAFRDALLNDPTLRTKLALGDQYELLRPDERAPEAHEDVRRARVDERLRMLTESRQVELEERLRLFAHEERVLHEEQHRLATAARAMRRSARAQLARETDAARWLEQQRFEADKKYIVDHERDLLLRRRRDYEAKVQASLPPSQLQPYGSPERPLPPGDVAPVNPDASMNNVVLVMTVAIGDDREDVITVREHDDHRRLAEEFAARHALPAQVIDPLIREIQRNLRDPPPRSAPPPTGAGTPRQGGQARRGARSQEPPVFDRLQPDGMRRR